MTNPLEKLQNRVLSKSGVEPSELTGILDFAREFGCLELILGSEEEVYSTSGKLLYVIKKKPVSLSVLNTLLKEFDIMKRIEKQQAQNIDKGSRRGRSRR